jgi:hypothetical protein
VFHLKGVRFTIKKIEKKNKKMAYAVDLETGAGTYLLCCNIYFDKPLSWVEPSLAVFSNIYVLVDFSAPA